MLTKSEINEALNWYKSARRFTRLLSKGSKLDRFQIAAMLAALSPANEWSNNKTETMVLVEFISRGYSLDKILSGYRFRTYKTMVKKAYQCSKTRDPLDHLKILNGPKIKAFYLNITGLCENTVTIDRHVLRWYLGDHESSFKDIPPLNKTLYRKISSVIQAKASYTGLKPCQVQALIWYHSINQLKQSKLNKTNKTA